LKIQETDMRLFSIAMLLASSAALGADWAQAQTLPDTLLAHLETTPSAAAPAAAEPLRQITILAGQGDTAGAMPIVSELRDLAVYSVTCAGANVVRIEPGPQVGEAIAGGRAWFVRLGPDVNAGGLERLRRVFQGACRA
jgi:hypothetical protein